IGGETAEMPGLYAPGDFDLAGFAIGAVERNKVLPRNDIGAGDVLLALPSSGAHSNGFSLIRKIIEDRQIDLAADASFATGQTIGEALLTPTRLYVQPALAAIATGKVKAMAHITGGGLLENLPRVLPEGLDAVIDLARLPPTPFYQWLCRQADLWLDEVFRTFNAGVGFVLVVAEDEAIDIEQVLRAAGEEPSVIGGLRPTDETPRTVLENISEEWWSCVSAS
ncbi:MAG: phosphoribosylformylglycinamidine cyclo-ligase, partial [Pseudomonadota bacterium]